MAFEVGKRVVFFTASGEEVEGKITARAFNDSHKAKYLVAAPVGHGIPVWVSADDVYVKDIQRESGPDDADTRDAG